MKKAFTLIEVNLAILVMAGGILSVVVLYSLGFRESRQSREDLASAAYADAVLGPLAGALSDMDVDWAVNFKGDEEWAYPGEKGWGEYLEDGKVKSSAKSLASSAFESALGHGKDAKVDWPVPDGVVGGLVVFHEKGSGVVKIGFRASKKLDALLTAPLYYTEVRFQGKQQ